MITVGILVSYLVAVIVLVALPKNAGNLDWRIILGVGAAHLLLSGAILWVTAAGSWIQLVVAGFATLALLLAAVGIGIGANPNRRCKGGQ